jgi:hypothetical protein
LIPGLKGRECRVVSRNEPPTHDTSSPWRKSSGTFSRHESLRLSREMRARERYGQHRVMSPGRRDARVTGNAHAPGRKARGVRLSICRAGMPSRPFRLALVAANLPQTKTASLFPVGNAPGGGCSRGRGLHSTVPDMPAPGVVVTAAGGTLRAPASREDAPAPHSRPAPGELARNPKPRRAARFDARRGGVSGVCPLRHPLLRLREGELHRLRPRLPGRLLLQGQRSLPVLHRPPHVPDGRAPRRPRHPAGPCPAVGDLGAETAAGRPRPGRRASPISTSTTPP